MASFLSMIALKPRNFQFKRQIQAVSHRGFAECSESGGGKKGLVIGVYNEPDSKEHKFTAAAQKFNSQTGGKLEELIKDGRVLTKGKTTLFQNLDSEYFTVAVVGLGSEDVGYNSLENLDECKENIRIAAASGARRLRKKGVAIIHLDGMGNAEAAGEGAGLAMWRFQENRNKENHKLVPSLELYFDADKEGWQRGLFKAEAQNLARRLSDSPANLMTPAIFAQNVVDALCPCGISVEVRDRDWIESKKMHAFLAVARGSCEPPVFIEINYCGGLLEEKPVVFVGKGITFDTGGLCLKKCHGMDEFRGDMSGAAVIVAVMRAVAALTLPLNIQAVIPLCENMPSGMAMKPGDVVIALNGKTIQITHTDNEGRLLLADALCFSYQNYKPRLVIDVATLTSGMKAALGSSSTGCFTNNHDLWKQMMKAGAITGDRVWRFPLWHHFTRKVTSITSADITNVGWGPGGGPCRAAAFLKEFILCGDWIHLDIASAGMLSHTHEFPYLVRGRMTGRPTRTIVQFLYQIACPPQEKKQICPPLP